MSKEVQIACPKCEWKPDGGEYWQCTCGHVWDTFKTAAKCPQCKKQWNYTQCIAWRGGCNQQSPHIDWYRNLDEILEEELTSVAETAPASGPKKQCA